MKDDYIIELDGRLIMRESFAGYHDAYKCIFDEAMAIESGTLNLYRVFDNDCQELEMKIIIPR